MSILLQMESAHFTYLRDEIGVSAGNISLQLDKLKEAGYVKIKKGQKNNYPLTTSQITEKGRLAFAQYLRDFKSYVAPVRKKSVVKDKTSLKKQQLSFDL
jgi:DNA-binding MarR family transcriptional regulator